MSGLLLLLAALLVGQVNSASDPYGASVLGQARGDEPPAVQSDDGLVPILQPPPSEARSALDAAASSQGGADPYGASARARRTQAGGEAPASPFGRLDSSRGTSSPPPGFGGIPAQSNPLGAALPENTGGQADDAALDSAPGMKPSALMRAMLTPPAASRLSGRPITLAEVIAGAASRSEQSQRIEAYWELCWSVAEYYLGIGEHEELRRLPPAVPRNSAVWQQAEKDLALRIDTSERAARASQYRLANWLGGSLPLPGDMPHCGSYHSRYEQIFAGRASAEAEALSELLPLRYAELKDAAAAVAQVQERLDAIQSMGNEESDGSGTLRALELWTLRRRAFIQIARDYNRRIARYSELATPGEVPADRLISMLILREKPSTAARTSSPASASDGRRNDDGESAPRTFSGGWLPAAPGSGSNSTRDDAVQPASGEVHQQPRRERSLLVKPR
jgi:hypothetical protein